MSHHERVVKINDNEIRGNGKSQTIDFKKPSIIGHFSLDKNRQYIPSTCNLLYFYSREEEIKNGTLFLNLNEGIHNVVRKEAKDEKLNHILSFIHKNPTKERILKDIGGTRKMLDADFVCYRGLLSKIMWSLHLKEPWIIYASKFKGTIYLCAAETKETYNISKEEMDKFCSWGFKFEQFMLTDKKGQAPDTSKPVNEAEEFNCVFKSKLGSFKLIYAAEMDGIICDTEINEDVPNWDDVQFIELKTNKNVVSLHEDHTLKTYKCIKWWTQSFLANVQQIYCGLRSRHGIVRNIVPIKVKDLPKIASNIWNWRICLNFCHTVLKVFNESIPINTNDKYSVWKFSWIPQYQQISITEIKGKSQYTFIPDWYE